MQAKIGLLDILPVADRLDFVADPVKDTIEKNLQNGEIGVVEIDPELADTAAFCEKYDVSSAQSANCVIVKAKRADREWYAACVILATTRADVNGLVRRHLDARRVSFAPMEEAVALTHMEYGGITPIGLPAGWPILIDKRVADSEMLIIGSGLRKSKLVVSGKLLSELPYAVVLENLGQTKTP